MLNRYNGKMPAAMPAFWEESWNEESTSPNQVITAGGGGGIGELKFRIMKKAMGEALLAEYKKLDETIRAQEEDGLVIDNMEELKLFILEKQVRVMSEGMNIDNEEKAINDFIGQLVSENVLSDDYPKFKVELMPVAAPKF